MLFLGIFTLVIKPGTPFWVQLLCGFEVSIASFLWFAFVARVMTLEAVRSRFSKMETTINRVMGAVLVAFGLRLALARRG